MKYRFDSAKLRDYISPSFGLIEFFQLLDQELGRQDFGGPLRKESKHKVKQVLKRRFGIVDRLDLTGGDQGIPHFAFEIVWRSVRRAPFECVNKAIKLLDWTSLKEPLEGIPGFGC